MRNFSFTAASSVSTYWVNSEYCKNAPELDQIVHMMAVAMDNDYKTQSKATKEAFDRVEFSQFVAASEYRAICDFVVFYEDVMRSIDRNDLYPKDADRVYVYFNMNTGRNFVWTHVVS